MGFEAYGELFVEEAMDLLRDLEAPLLELETHPERTDLIDTIFRAMHTIKGSAGMVGFEEISHFTHDIENTFDAVRKRTIPVTAEIIELTLSAKDCIRELLLKNNSEAEQDKRAMILSRLAQISGKKTEDQPVPTESTTVGSSSSERTENQTAAAYHITFIPDRNIFLRGVRIQPLLADLDSLGQMVVRTSFADVPCLETFDPEQCYLSWSIDLLTLKSEEDIRSVFIFVEEYAKITIEKVDGADVPPVLAIHAAPTTTPVNADAPKAAPILERRHVDASSIRVKNEKLDMLVNLVGEMVTLHARLSQESNNEHLPEFISISESLGRLTADLRDITMSVRMVPLAETFSSFTRLIHDLSKNLGKQIRLEMSGGETELDKNVIEELRDPLMHLIRNSADHGIELPEKRRSAGKDETGVIRLSAEHTGANVRICVADDGTGLNRQKIVSTAIARGMTVPPDADDAYIHQLIFEPGFSTAEKATDISGRGVGMDVVKKNIEKLHGSISIATDEGKGSSISLTIPLTLAIIDGFMTEVCGQYYIFNLSLVRECIAYEKTADSKEFNGLVRIRDTYIPFVDLGSVFGFEGGNSPYPQIVVTEHEGNTIGFLVDRVVGHCQTVIKPLGKGVRNADMFSGAAILGDGSIALILDVNSIIGKAEIKGINEAGSSALYADAEV